MEAIYKFLEGDLIKETLKELIERARAHDPCEGESELVEGYRDLDHLIAESSEADVSYWCFWYAENVLKKPWVEAEPLILKSYAWAYLYVLKVRPGRWKEFEKIIDGSPLKCFRYARFVMKGRWREAEKTIAKDEKLKGIYERYFECEI